MRLRFSPLPLPLLALLTALLASAQPATEPVTPPVLQSVKLTDVRLRDSCILPDEATKTYYLVSAGRRGPNGRATVVQYSSKDLHIWNGPRVIFEVPEDCWGDRGIWAPEIHRYKGKYYLFLTFDSSHLLTSSGATGALGCSAAHRCFGATPSRDRFTHSKIAPPCRLT